MRSSHGRLLALLVASFALAHCGGSPSSEPATAASAHPEASTSAAPPPSTTATTATPATATPTTATTTPATTTPSAATSSATPTSEPAVVAPAGTAGKSTLVVAFISPGNGTDRDAFDRLRAMLKTLAKPPPFTSNHWGKEGEHDECFDLATLSSAERRAFVARVKQAVGGSKKVTIAEDGTCHEGR